MEEVVGGYRVIGPNTVDGTLHAWAFPNLDAAQQFARHLCEQLVAGEVPRVKNRAERIEVCKLEGIWRPAKPPIEFTSADKLR